MARIIRIIRLLACVIALAAAVRFGLRGDTFPAMLWGGAAVLYALYAAR